MDPRKLFLDERLTGTCVFCGGSPDTRDHVPAKVLLDDPLPANLPVVGACASCNAGFSVDEQYLACFLDCVVSGTTEPEGVQREKAGRILAETPALRQRIESSRGLDADGRLLWNPEVGRVRNVLLKLARGHAAYELYPCQDEPSEIAFVPLPVLADHERAHFERAPTGELAVWPEIGSRAFFRACGKLPDSSKEMGGWIVVQPGRYRYSALEVGGVLVRLVLSEYLACTVFWE